MELFEALKKRYSFRGIYESAPVPREDLIKIMEAGLAAPSGCNKQTTSLIAVDDPAMLQKFGEWMERRDFGSAPAGVCVLTDRAVAYRDRCFATQDYAAAIENMLLAITALGYQSCWVEGHITDEDKIGRKMADLLGVPDEMDLVAYLPVGVPTEESRRVSKRPFAERAWLNGFEKPFPQEGS